MAKAIIFMLAAGLISQAPPPRPAGSTRVDLQRHDLSTKGKEVLQARVDFSPKAFFPSHKHPGEEVIYVLSGTIEYEVAGKLTTLKAGDVLFVPDGVWHAARNIGESPASELATYVLRKGEPLTTFAPQEAPKPAPVGMASREPIRQLGTNG